MQLYLLRHGIAEVGRPSLPDADRALTSEGKRKLRVVLKLARDAGVQPALIMTSPYRRALDTAEIAADCLGYKGSLLRTEALIPAGRPENVWDEIKTHKNESQVLISGHDPLLSLLTGYLLQHPDLLIDFKKGAILRIDLDRFDAAPKGVLKWMLAPKLAL